MNVVGWFEVLCSWVPPACNHLASLQLEKGASAWGRLSPSTTRHGRVKEEVNTLDIAIVRMKKKECKEKDNENEEEEGMEGMVSPWFSQAFAQLHGLVG